jgi:hypothetical protein
VLAAAVVAVGVALVYATRPPPILATGQPDPFTVGMAILMVGYFLFPFLAFLAVALPFVAVLLVAARLIGSRSAGGSGGSPGGSRAQLLLIPLGAVLLGVFYLAFMTLRAGDTMHIDVTPYSTAVAFVAGLAIASGVVIVVRVREIAVGTRFGIAIGGLVFGVLALFSIGVLILPVALVLLGFGTRQLVRRASGAAVRAALAGAVAGVGAVFYFIVLIQPAVAECRANGGGATSSGGLFGSIALSQGGYSLPNGESGGYIDEGDRIAYFSCRDGKMTNFHRESLPLGTWVVTTEPAATVGRTVMVVFRVRPASGAAGPADGFDFTAVCRTCAEPRPEVRAHADRLGTRAPGTPGASVTFAGQVVFPAAGSWYTSPYDGPIEVR